MWGKEKKNCLILLYDDNCILILHTGTHNYKALKRPIMLLKIRKGVLIFCRKKVLAFNFKNRLHHPKIQVLLIKNSKQLPMCPQLYFVRDDNQIPATVSLYISEHIHRGKVLKVSPHV